MPGTVRGARPARAGRVPPGEKEIPGGHSSRCRLSTGSVRAVPRGPPNRSGDPPQPPIPVSAWRTHWISGVGMSVAHCPGGGAPPVRRRTGLGRLRGRPGPCRRRSSPTIRAWRCRVVDLVDQSGVWCSTASVRASSLISSRTESERRSGSGPVVGAARGERGWKGVTFDSCTAEPQDIAAG